MSNKIDIKAIVSDHDDKLIIVGTVQDAFTSDSLSRIEKSIIALNAVGIKLMLFTGNERDARVDHYATNNRIIFDVR